MRGVTSNVSQNCTELLCIILNGGSVATSVVNVTDTYELVQPNPELFMPLEMRREFLLSNGEKGLLLTTNLTGSYEGYLVGHENGNVTIIKELFGLEKS